jgi:hypothetical protein
MERSPLIAIVALITLTFASVCLAQDGQRKAATDFQALTGLWRCDNRTVGEGSHAFKSIWNFRPEFGERTYVARWNEFQSAEHAQPTDGIHLWSYDAKLDRYFVDGLNSGTNRFTWTSQPSEWTETYPFRYVWAAEGFQLPIVRKNPNEWTWAAQIKDGTEWVTVSEGTCRK